MKLSVIIISYNQEKYIRQALDGVVKQKTSFPFEVIVADDCSSDETLSICNGYAQEYSYIKILSNKENIGYTKNWERALALGDGEYVAVFEGDDYWTDPLKLQKQVDFLDANSAIGLCYTDCDILNDETQLLKKNVFQNEICVFNAENPILSKGYASNVTWVFRRKLLKNIQIPKNNTDVPWILLYEFCLATKIEFLPDSTGVWRRHNGSFSNDFAKTDKMYNYDKNVFLWKKNYVSKFPDVDKNKNVIYTRALLNLWTYAKKIDDVKIINELQTFFVDKCDLDKLTSYIERQECLIERKQKDIDGLLKSNRYRLGTIILYPINILRKFFNK